MLRPNQRWIMGFVEGALASGRKLCTLTIVDEFSRQFPRIEVATSLPGARVVRALNEIIAILGKPESLLVDNRPEFIGQHFARLFRFSAEIVAISRSRPPAASILDGISYIQGDCALQDFLRQVLRIDDYVTYLAYNSVPKTSFEDPLLDIQENLPLAISLLSVLRDVPVKRLLYVSSGGTVYGPTEADVPIAQDDLTNPVSPYGITKLAVEKYCRMYARMFGIPVVIARPSNPYGSGQVPYRGQGFIATALAKILQGEEIPIFGTHGTVRDYLYIDDLCVAIKVLLDVESAPGAIFNIGSGIGMNNLEVLQAVARAAGCLMSDLKLNFLPARNFDVA